MISDVHCSVCDVCASKKSPNKLPKAPLQTYNVPNERWALDILGPLPMTHRKNQYVLVMGDYFTKWVDAVPIRYKKATTVAQKVVD